MLEQLYLADYQTNPPTTESDPTGVRAYFYRRMIELARIVEIEVKVGNDGDEELNADVRVEFPDDANVRLLELLGMFDESRLRGLAAVFEDYVRQARERIADIAKRNGDSDHGLNFAEQVIVTASLAISTQINVAVKQLLETNALDDKDIAGEAAADADTEPDEWDNWLEKHPDDAIVADGEEEPDEPWRESAVEGWRPEDDEDDEPCADGESGMFLGTPSPAEVDPETEALILAEAIEVVVDMNMIVDSYLRLQEHLRSLQDVDPNVPDLREEYQETIVAVMRHIASLSGGKTNLECVAIELGSPAVLELMEGLNELEIVGCVDSVFHNVAETALMQVGAYSDMVDANAIGEDNENDENLELTLTFIRRLRERLDID